MRYWNVKLGPLTRGRKEQGEGVGGTGNYTPFNLALNAGFIALTWTCVHASLLSSPDILDLRLQDSESNLANENQQKKTRDPEELMVHISRARLFATPSYAIRGSGYAIRIRRVFELK